MTLLNLNWPTSPEKAVRLQQELVSKIEHTPRLNPIRYVAGLDVHIRDEMGRAAIVVLDIETLKPVDAATAIKPMNFPHKPGMLIFREGPVIFEALKRLDIWPDLLIFYGQGIAYPDKIGLASYLGALIDLPVIGCARTQTYGDHRKVPFRRGTYVLLRDNGAVIGAALRTRDGGNLLYVSPGHRLNLKTSIRYILMCCRHHAIPETNRWSKLFLGRVNTDVVRNNYK